MPKYFPDPRLSDTRLSRDELIRVMREELLRMRGFLLAYQSATGDPATPGVETFLDLTDTPNSYSGEAGNLVAVNGGETGLEFIAPSASGEFSTIQTYTPTWTAELYGDGPDVDYPTDPLANPTIGNGSINGFFKYNDDYLHCWGNIQAGTTTTFGVGRWVIGIPTSPAFSPPANARSVIGSCMARANNDDGSGQPSGNGTFIQGISVYGGPPDRLPATIDDGGASEIDIQVQSTTGIRLATQAFNDFLGVLDGGNGVPVVWESTTDTWIYWDILIPLR